MTTHHFVPHWGRGRWICTAPEGTWIGIGAQEAQSLLKFPRVQSSWKLYHLLGRCSLLYLDVLSTNQCGFGGSYSPTSFLRSLGRDLLPGAHRRHCPIIVPGAECDYECAPYVAHSHTFAKGPVTTQPLFIGYPPINFVPCCNFAFLETPSSILMYTCSAYPQEYSNPIDKTALV